MAARKTTKKTKEPAAKKAPKTPAPKRGFSLLDDGAVLIQNANAAATDLKHRKKNRRGGFATMDQVRREMTTLPHFMWQYLLSSYGLRRGCVLEIIGEPGVGKTSLVMSLLAQAMLYDNAPCFYTAGDSKPMAPNRIERLMHRDPVTAKKMAALISYSECHTLAEMQENWETWIKSMRGVGVKGDTALPLNIPLVTAIEHPGKLLSKAEALGYYDYADYLSDANKKKLKAVGEGSNLGHSNFAHGFFRRVQMVCDVYNVFIIWTSHQNENIDMSGSAPGYLPEKYKKLRNKTKNMGRAVDQNAAYQLILAHTGTSKLGDEANGKKIAVRVEKNSYGPHNREMEYELWDTHTRDTETFLEPVFHHEKAFAKLMAEKKLMGTTSSDGKLTCKPLGLIGLSEEEFEQAVLSDENTVNRLGKMLQIDGYDDTVDLIEKEAEQSAPKSEPPPPPPPESFTDPDNQEQESENESGE